MHVEIMLREHNMENCQTLNAHVYWLYLVMIFQIFSSDGQYFLLSIPTVVFVNQFKLIPDNFLL